MNLRLPAVWCGSLVVLSLFIATAEGRGDSPFGLREKRHQPLGPLAEQALAALAEKAEPLERALLMRHMDWLVEEMLKVFPMTPEEREALKLDATSLVNAAAKSWKECVAADLRPLLPKYGDDDSMAKRVGVWTSDQLVPLYAVRNWTLPDQLPQWARVVEQRLGAERAAAWQKVRAAQRVKTLEDIDKFVENWANTGRLPMDNATAAHMELLRKVTRTTQAQADDIAARVRALKQAHVDSEKEEAKDMLGSMPDEPLKSYLGGTKTLNSRFMRPTEAELTAAWRRLAVEVVGEAALKQWDEGVKQQELQHAERVAALIKPGEARLRTEQEDLLRAEVENFVATLTLTAERRGKLEALAKQAVDDSLVVSREQWLDTVEKLSAEDLEKGRRPSLIIRLEDRASQRPVWLKGLEQMFTAAELEEAENSKKSRLRRLNAALAKVALSEADFVLGFSTSQRVELEPLVEQQMSGLVRAERPAYWSVTCMSLMQMTRRTPQSKAEALLDKAQMAHWVRLEKVIPDTRTIVMAMRPVSQNASVLPGVADVATEVSQYLHKRALTQREESLRLMHARVEDAQRVLQLPKDKVARLTTAAKGAVETEMASWRARMESLANERIVGATPQNIRVLLAGLDNMKFGVSTEAAANRGVWQQAVEETLSGSQRETWDKAVAERRAYRVAALAAVATAELDRRHQLSPSQCAKVQAILEGVVGQHLKSIDAGRLNGQGWAWYLNSNSALMPVGGAAKAELQAVLTPHQWKNFQERDKEGADRLWKSLQQRGAMDGGGVLINQGMLFFP